jgi:hypothetical protein
MRGDGGLFEHSFFKGASISDAAFRSIDVRVPTYIYIYIYIYIYKKNIYIYIYMFLIA